MGEDLVGSQRDMRAEVERLLYSEISRTCETEEERSVQTKR